MDDARAHGARSLQSEQLHDLDRVVVAVPDGDLPRRELVGDLLGRAACEIEGERGHAPLHRPQPVELDRLREPVEEPCAELPFVGHDRLPAERLDVLDRGDEAGEELVLQRAVLEAAADGLVRRRARLVRAQALEQLTLAERQPHVRAEELVRRAEEHVDVPAGDVDRAVRPVVDGVGPGERAGAVGELDDACHVGRRPDRVRGDRERDHLRALGELRLEVVQVERQVVVHAGEADDDAEVLRELEPRRDVRVVVEPGADDLVARARASGRARA